MQIHNRFRLVAYAVTLVGLAINARADISASGWMVPDGGASGTLCADNAVLACVPTVPAEVSFTLTNSGLAAGLNPTDTTSISTVDAFIKSVGASNLVSGPTYEASSGVTSSTLLDSPAANYGLTGHLTCTTSSGANGFGCGVIFEFTGTANFTSGETFSVTADDGFSLYVGGSNFLCSSCSMPGPESITTHTLTYGGTGAPTGMQSFTFVYAECCTLPATFSTNLSAGGNLPEPSSMILLGTVVALAACRLRRRYSQNV